MNSIRKRRGLEVWKLDFTCHTECGVGAEGTTKLEASHGLRNVILNIKRFFGVKTPQNDNDFQTFKCVAFSLIELIISLIAISVITAAFTPVISKKIKSGEIAIGGKSFQLTNECSSIDPYCEFCDMASGVCYQCQRPCNEGYGLNKGKCQCVLCTDSEKGVANCGYCLWNSEEEKVYCTRCNNGYYLKSDNTCEECPAGYSCDGSTAKTKCPKGTYAPKGSSSCTPCYNSNEYQDEEGMGSCKTCISGLTSKSDNESCNCTANCNSCNNDGSCIASGCVANYESDGSGGCKLSIAMTQVGSRYWSLYNAGDPKGPVIPPTVNIQNVNTNTCTRGASSAYPSCGGSVPTCKQGRTETNGNECYNWGYDGCTRTICNQYAAKLICQYNNMRLPTTNDFDTLTDNGNLTYNQALQFCSFRSNNQTYAVCYQAQNFWTDQDRIQWNAGYMMCPGYGGHYCWTSCWMGADSFVSVRCVKDL